MSLIRFAFPIASLMAGGVWMASGASKAELDFPVPAKDVVQRLAGASRTVEGTGMGSLTLSGTGLDPRSVRISVSRAGSPNRVKCTVLVADENEASSSASGSTLALSSCRGGSAAKLAAAQASATSVKKSRFIGGGK